MGPFEAHLFHAGLFYIDKICQDKICQQGLKKTGIDLHTTKWSPLFWQIMINNCEGIRDKNRLNTAWVNSGPGATQLAVYWWNMSQIDLYILLNSCMSKNIIKINEN